VSDSPAFSERVGHVVVRGGQYRDLVGLPLTWTFVEKSPSAMRRAPFESSVEWFGNAAGHPAAEPHERSDGDDRPDDDQFAVVLLAWSLTD